MRVRYAVSIAGNHLGSGRTLISVGNLLRNQELEHRTRQLWRIWVKALAEANIEARV